MQTEYQYVAHPAGLKELLQLHPTYGSRALRFKTQNNPEFVNFTFGEWFRAARTARMFPLMSIGDRVYFAASFMGVTEIPSLQEFVSAPEKYRVPMEMCFSKHSYSRDGFIGAFAHFTIEEILGNEDYLRRYRNARKLEGTRWNSQGRDDVLIRGNDSESKYWDRVVPIGKGNKPTADFGPFHGEGRIARWSGVFDEGIAERLRLFFQRW